MCLGVVTIEQHTKEDEWHVCLHSVKMEGPNHLVPGTAVAIAFSKEADARKYMTQMAQMLHWNVI